MIIDASVPEHRYVVKDVHGELIKDVYWCNTNTGEVEQIIHTCDSTGVRRYYATYRRTFFPAPLQVFLNDRRVF